VTIQTELPHPLVALEREFNMAMILITHDPGLSPASPVTRNISGAGDTSRRLLEGMQHADGLTGNLTVWQ
jgi:hypothetical protein